MFDRKAYLDFIASKGSAAQSAGFTPGALPDRLFAHQERATRFALEKGRAALFLDTGLGKSGCEAVFADECARETGKPSLILTPLAVARQMQRECAAFGVEAEVIREAGESDCRVQIANYERLRKLDVGSYGAVVLDESSILKAFSGSTKRALVEAFKETPFRLAATATPAPNDHMELGQHSEFLGVMPGSEMLTRWFVNDQTSMGKYRLKGHGARPFWRWVASWGRAASLPSDLGGDDDGFVLPPLRHQVHVCDVDLIEDAGDDMFRIPSASATDVHREKQRTLMERVVRSADIANKHNGYVIVWCERDDESAALADAIPGAVEVKGSMTVDAKEAALESFATGHTPVMVTKPKLAGFGLNLQHCDCQVFASVSHSYEQYYQAIRRSWRFGQVREVTAHMVMTETELPIWRNVQRKAADHDAMKAAMTKTKHERLLYKNIHQNSRVSAMGMPEYILVMRKDSRGVKTGNPVRHAVEKWGDERMSGEAVEIAHEQAQRMLTIGMIDMIDQRLIDELARMAKVPLPQWQEWASPVWMSTMQTDVLNAAFKGDDREERHLCPMPLDLIERCLRLYSNPGDLVLDPFNGIGSTGYQALKMGRRYLGVELKPEYAAQAAKFLTEAEERSVSMLSEGAA